MQKRKPTSQVLKKRARRGPGGTFFRVMRWFMLICLAVAAALVVAVGGTYFYLSENLPRISSLEDYRPPVISTVFSDDNRKIAEFYKERRVVIPLSKMSPLLKNAFVAAEDGRFYKHQGIDLISIVRAFFKNMEAGTIVQGGSTITQQVAKSFFLTPERSYRRKIKEAILAYRIDKQLSKDEILFLYLNQIYLGHGAYGVEAAAQSYFGKSAAELNLAECAMLAGLPQAPSRYSPFAHPERAKQRQIYVLNRMVEDGYITNIQATDAINRKLDIKARRDLYMESAPFFTEYIRQYVEKKYGSEALYTGGLKIYATVNMEMQKAARSAILKGLRDLDKRQGYRGPLRHLAAAEIEDFASSQQKKFDQKPLGIGQIVKGVVVAVDDLADRVTVRMGNSHGVIPIQKMRWARKPDPHVAYFESRIGHPSQALRTGDVILVRLESIDNSSKRWNLALEQAPKAQAALLCMAADSGQIKAMIGGRDFRKSQFNRAIQSRRQPGSAFKPIIYAAALDKGYTPATVVIDSPIVYEETGRDFTWKPKNYEKKFHGPTLFRRALEKSMNVVTIKILRDIGVDYTIDYAHRLGIGSNLSRDLSLALGSSGVSLLEIVKAYAVFDNLGYRQEPVFITRIADRNGKVLEEGNPGRVKVIDRDTAYIMTSLLEGVVKHGTGWRVRALKRPVAGKTGTTNNLHDAWFVGYTPRYVTGVWVGFDNSASLGKGETGSRAASPIWLDFMQHVLQNKPVRVFQVPEGVVFAKIDAHSGLLPNDASQKTIFECFKEGTAPTEYTRKPGTYTDSEQFFKKGI